MKPDIKFLKSTLLLTAIYLVSTIVNAQPAPGSFKQTWGKGPDWLKNAVIYQIYPSSFKDSDGNGIGDIPGIISKLDYIQSLGVSAIWFNPVFESSWLDGGYDVKDFYRVDPRFGTNDDLVNLIEQAHERGLKVLLDLVAGHTSYEHPWFKQSCEDTNLRYSDYYIWSDRLPSEKAERELEEMLKDENYMQNTTGDWMKSKYPRNRFYQKNFFASQPALNYGYANPDPNHPWEQSVDAPGPKAVRQELKNIIAFWYNKGVNGFRVDLASTLVKNDKDYEQTIKLWREIREWSDSNFPDHVLIAEWGEPKYCLASGFNIDMNLTQGRFPIRRMFQSRRPLSDGGSYFSLNGAQPAVNDLYGNPIPKELVDTLSDAAGILKTWYTDFTENIEWTKDWGYYAVISSNHDQYRPNMSGRNSPQQLKVIMTWILSTPLPIVYYGDEIGLRSLCGLPGKEGSNYNGLERSGARTPMQWNATETAGFSTCRSEDLYLPVCLEWTRATSYNQYLQWKAAGAKNPASEGTITVECEDADPHSLLNWVRSLIKLRKDTKAFWANSRFIPIYSESNPYPMVFVRSDGVESYLVALNPTSKNKSITIDHMASGCCNIVMSQGKVSYKALEKGDRISMSPVSIMIVKIK